MRSPSPRSPRSVPCHTLWMGLLTAPLLLGGCQWPGTPEEDPEQRGYFTIGEVRDRKETLAGSAVRVRGWGRLKFSKSLQTCSPARCNCNTSVGKLDLHNRPRPDVFADFALHLPQLSCAGDECTATCKPFDPRARAYELVGTLRVDGNTLTLEQLDFTASSQLSGSGEDLSALSAAPLAQGDVTVPVSSN